MQTNPRIAAPSRAIDRFLARVPRAPRRVLILDYDGTIAPFHVRPREALPYPGVAPRLAALRERCATRVVIVSGRSMSDLDVVLSGVPHDDAWASHGWQRRLGAGRPFTLRPSAAAQDVLHAAALAAAPLLRKGARLECKPAGVAVHWRGLAPRVVAELRHELDVAWQGGGGPKVQVLPFDGGVEMRARGRDKGVPVREVLRELGPGTACAYVGDDVTDEDAFAALGSRGLALRVASEARPTAAHACIGAPEGLLAFLDAWIAAAAARA